MGTNISLNATKDSPPQTILEEAIAQLGSYYGIVTANEFMGKLLGYSANQPAAGTSAEGNPQFEVKAVKELWENAINSTSDPINHLTKAVLGVTDGGMFISDFNNTVDDFFKNTKGTSHPVVDRVTGKTGERLFTVTHDNGHPAAKGGWISQNSVIESIAPGTILNQAPSNPSKEQPSLGVITFHAAALNFANRDTGATSIFLSAIPTIEMSLCQPYIDVMVITKESAYEEKSDHIGSGISQWRFLVGKQAVDEALWKTQIAGTPVDLGPVTLQSTQQNEEDINRTYAGMEVFTSPQTLTNGWEPHFDIGPDGMIPNSTGDSPIRGTSVIDRFRPFMTLTGLKMSCTPAGGPLSFKTAEMNIKLHDRSRLHEISQLIAPGEMQDVEFLITYGWSHPNPQSPYGALLNSFRIREKYGVSSSNYNFDPSGEVEITLQLFMLGAKEATYQLINDDQAGESLQVIKDAVKSMQLAKKELKPLGFDNLADIVAGGDVLGKLTNVGAILSLNSKDIKKLKAIHKKLSSRSSKANAAMKDLSGGCMDAIAGLGSYQKRLRILLQQKITACTINEEPFLKDSLGQGIKYVKLKKRKGRARVKWASFAKIALNFIGEPIAQTGAFDEVQLLFYPMNEYASFARDDDTGSFPIEMTYFQRKLQEIFQKRSAFTVGQFINFMNSQFFGNLGSVAYGFGSIYGRDKKSGKAKLQKYYKSKKRKHLLPSAKEKVLKEAYKGSDCEMRFKMPSLAIYIETVPHRTNNKKTICRIHFFDKAATSYVGFAEMWNSIKDTNFGIINKKIAKETSSKSKNSEGDAQQNSSSQYGALYNAQIDIMKNMDIVEAIQKSPKKSGSDDDSAKGQEEKNYFRIKGGPAGLRYAFSKYMPTIKYGSEFSAVTNASLATQSDPALATIHMMKAPKRETENEDTEPDDGLPLRVFPVSLSLTTFGCPFITFGQQFFVDFGTGTSIDDIYVVTGVSHSFEMGSYKTDVELTGLGKSGQFESLIDNLNKGSAAANDLHKKLGG